MNTFQAIVYSIVHGFTIFLPLSNSAHHWFVPYLLHWPEATGAFAGILSLSSLAALFVYFRHDWMSIFSSLLRVLLLWKKPMTLDERMPFFILVSILPLIAAEYFLSPDLLNTHMDPLWYAGSVIVFAFPLLLAEQMNRKTKTMLDWNLFDSFLTGLTQVVVLIPGAGRQVAVLAAALFRNYNREAAAKFTLLSLFPLLAMQSYFSLKATHAHTISIEWGWPLLVVSFVISFLSSLLAIDGFMKNLQRKGFGGYVFYCCVLGIGIGLVYWWRSL